MSRIAKQIIKLGANVSYKIENDLIVFKGPEGENVLKMEKGIVIEEVAPKEYKFSGGKTSAILGTFVMNFKNCATGVAKKFEKNINLVGVGYKVVKKDHELEFSVGYSKNRIVPIEKNIECSVVGLTELTVKSVDKMLLGNFCANLVKNTRKPEPYKGKGVIIKGSFVRRKAGKKK